MPKNSNKFLEKSRRLKKEKGVVQQKLPGANESIEAIKKRSIYPLAIADNKKIKLLKETTADKIFRILIEKMNEGAVTLNKEGIILYCNTYFADMVNLPLPKVTGTKFENFIDEVSTKQILHFLKKSGNNTVKRETFIYTTEGRGVPVLMSLNTLALDCDFVVGIILTDLTIQNKNEEELKVRAKQLEQKNIDLKKVNKELLFQNEEKHKRAAELIIANEELLFQNKEKEKRAAELIIANKELLFQSEEKETQSSELVLANKELLFQNEEKEKRAAELLMANKELEAFTYISSHDLQEPLRKIQTFANLVLQKEYATLSDGGKGYFLRMRDAANRMQTLLEDLLAYSHTNAAERKFEKTGLNTIVEKVKNELKHSIDEKDATIEAAGLCKATIIPFQFQQLFSNLICNALKFSKPGTPPHIIIKSKIMKYSGRGVENLLPGKKCCHISICDNGIGFEPKFKDKIFEVFQRLHSVEEYTGTGIGLAIVKKIVENHNGTITASGDLGEGARFDIYIPV